MSYNRASLSRLTDGRADDKIVKWLFLLFVFYVASHIKYALYSVNAFIVSLLRNKANKDAQYKNKKHTHLLGLEK